MACRPAISGWATGDTPGDGIVEGDINPFIQIESPAFADVTDQTGQPLNGVLKAAKTLVSGERGNDNRGNFGRVILTEAGLDRFSAGTGAELFANDFTIRVSVQNTVRGVSHFVAGTFTQIYGQ